MAVERRGLLLLLPAFRFAQIVQERRQPHRLGGGRSILGCGQRMVEDIVGVMRVLGHAATGRQLGEDPPQQAGLVQGFEGGGRVRRGEELGQFLADALERDLLDARGAEDQGAVGPGLELEAKLGAETHPPQQAQAVFVEPLFRAADGAQEAAMEVVQSARGVGQPVLPRVVGQGIDGEIPADEVFLVES